MFKEGFSKKLLIYLFSILPNIFFSQIVKKTFLSRKEPNADPDKFLILISSEFSISKIILFIIIPIKGKAYLQINLFKQYLPSNFIKKLSSSSISSIIKYLIGYFLIKSIIWDESIVSLFKTKLFNSINSSIKFFFFSSKFL